MGRVYDKYLFLGYGCFLCIYPFYILSSTTQKTSANLKPKLQNCPGAARQWETGDMFIKKANTIDYVQKRIQIQNFAARNAEKAMTTLARWRAAQVQETGGQRERRPYLASECTDLPQAEKWRLQIVREIAKKVAQIQNAGLGEFRIRDLNDEINKLMREKRHWEVQIKSLGGPDHARVGPRMLDQDGREVPGNRGYKYFGAAKDLPGVRELFEQEPPPPPRRTRADLMRDVDADYYGYRDDDDGLLIPLEREAEKEAIARAVDEWKRNKEENKDQDVPEEENIYPEDPDDKRVDDDDSEPQIITSHVAVPSQKDIEEALLRKKKQELLERYGCLDVKMEQS